MNPKKTGLFKAVGCRLLAALFLANMAPPAPMALAEMETTEPRAAKERSGSRKPRKARKKRRKYQAPPPLPPSPQEEYSQQQEFYFSSDDCDYGEGCEDDSTSTRFLVAVQPMLGAPLTYGGHVTLGVSHASGGMGLSYQGLSVGGMGGTKSSAHALIEAGMIGIVSFRAAVGSRFKKEGGSELIFELGAGIIVGLAYVRIGRSQSEVGVQMFLPVTGG